MADRAFEADTGRLAVQLPLCPGLCCSRCAQGCAGSTRVRVPMGPGSSPHSQTLVPTWHASSFRFSWPPAHLPSPSPQKGAQGTPPPATARAASLLPPQPHQADGHACHSLNLSGLRFLLCKMRSLNPDISQISEWRHLGPGNWVTEPVPGFLRGGSPPVGQQLLSEPRGRVLPLKTPGAGIIHWPRPRGCPAPRQTLMEAMGLVVPMCQCRLLDGAPGGEAAYAGQG